MAELTPFDKVHRRLAGLGIRLECHPGEYRVNWKGGKEAEWAYFENLGDATARGEDMAAERPLQPPVSSRRRRYGKPVYRTAKAYFKAIRKAHNKTLWAGTVGKIITH
jgi:hypothetical protein